MLESRNTDTSLENTYKSSNIVLAYGQSTRKIIDQHFEKRAFVFIEDLGSKISLFGKFEVYNSTFQVAANLSVGDIVLINSLW